MSPRYSLALLALAAALVLPSPAAGAIAIGPSNVFSAPGVAVDAAGTAYVAWRGAESGAGSLQFCRLPRGAAACDSRHAIATPGDSVSRAFVLVSGSRVTVVQYRYGGVPGGFSGLLSYTSNDRGASFGAAVRIGSEAFHEAVPGPGDTLSGIANNSSFFQNAPLGGVASTRAELSADHPYNPAVGLINAGTPLAVFADGSGAGQFRRYDGSGSLNDVANWTAPVELGETQYPKLAGGPSGLFLLSTVNAGTLSAQKWNGTTFGPRVTVANGAEQPSLHAFQDAGGRLHAVFVHPDADGLHLRHAVSDDGVAWRSGTVVTQTGSEGGFGSIRVATAPDHIGVVAWNAGGGQIRVAAVGPDAPVDPVAGPPPPATVPPAVTKRKPSITATGSAKRAGSKVRVRINGKLHLPAGVSKALGCSGKVKLTLKRGRKVLTSRTLTVRSSCAFALKGTLKRSKLKRAKKLTLTFTYSGNGVLAPVKKTGSLKVKR
jgi:hypothetical protein